MTANPAVDEILAGMPSAESSDASGQQVAGAAALARLKSGATFVLDDRAELDPIWGSGDEVLWASLEPLLIVGPTGVGKTTLALQLLAARLGILDQVLGWPVKLADSPILYRRWTDPCRSAVPCGGSSAKSIESYSRSAWLSAKGHSRSISVGFLNNSLKRSTPRPQEACGSTP